MSDGKLSPLGIVSLSGWAFREPEHRSRIPRSKHPSAHRARAAVRRVFRRRSMASREALPQRDGRHLHPG
jgi:hypothetical protein